MDRQRLRIQVGWTRVAVIMTANTAAIIVIAGLHPSGTIRSLAARHRASLFAIVQRPGLPVQPRSGLVIGALSRSEESRVGEGCGSPGRCGWRGCHKKKK